MTKKDDALAALARTEAAQAELRDMLRGVELAALNQRPPSGVWSPMENVRHLLFAQQHHFGPHLPKGFRWTSAGVPPPNRTGERRLSPVGSAQDASIDEVFDAWAKINDVVRGLCDDPDDNLVWRLEGNLSHVRLHIRAIENLLRA
jgi:hypothetical protein